MLSLKQLIIGAIIGLLIGLWFGVNIGKGNKIYSNPFAERTVTDKLKSSIGEGVEKAGKSIEKLGEDIKGNLDR